MAYVACERASERAAGRANGKIATPAVRLQNSFACARLISRVRARVTIDKDLNLCCAHYNVLCETRSPLQSALGICVLIGNRVPYGSQNKLTRSIRLFFVSPHDHRLHSAYALRLRLPAAAAAAAAWNGICMSIFFVEKRFSKTISHGVCAKNTTGPPQRARHI